MMRVILPIEDSEGRVTEWEMFSNHLGWTLRTHKSTYQLGSEWPEAVQKAHEIAERSYNSRFIDDLESFYPGKKQKPQPTPGPLIVVPDPDDPSYLCLWSELAEVVTARLGRADSSAAAANGLLYSASPEMLKVLEIQKNMRGNLYPKWLEDLRDAAILKASG